ncbi:hypothetical protein HanIR_Chr13g0636091 [Helianthus annuus]|nr:hypothetical protein HanIR_Chr13g0636091 [Helianthus annuus]
MERRRVGHRSAPPCAAAYDCCGWLETHWFHLHLHLSISLITTHTNVCDMW